MTNKHTAIIYVTTRKCHKYKLFLDWFDFNIFFNTINSYIALSSTQTTSI